MQSGEFRISNGADRGQRVSCTRRRIFRPNAPAEPAQSSGNVRSIGAQRFSGAGLARIGNSLIRPPRGSFQQRWTTARTDTVESFITDFPDSKQISRIAPLPLRRHRSTSPDDALCDGTPVGVRHEELPEVVHKERSSGLVGRGVASAHGADPWNPFHPGNP